MLLSLPGTFLIIFDPSTEAVELLYKIKGLYSYQTEQIIELDRPLKGQLFRLFSSLDSGKSPILEAMKKHERMAVDCNTYLTNTIIMTLRFQKIRLIFNHFLSWEFR